jgi:hypothetical protein
LSLPPDFDDRFQKGQFVGSIYGHGGSITEPYSTLRLYQGASMAVPGAHLVNFAKWKNTEFDKITDEMYVTDPNNKPRRRLGDARPRLRSVRECRSSVSLRRLAWLLRSSRVCPGLCSTCRPIHPT